ncbi:MAG TPA: hypothetical protein VLI93_02200 [Acetobacteraceae bacterium]|nr:hypothetical protein [Acetobacteraceae bacterium]
MRRHPPARASVLLGILLLARGRADGLRQFGDSPAAFLTSLAPLIAFPLVGGMLMLLQGGGWAALSDLLATLCALLAPPVLAYELVRMWKREARWLRFATALNWCQWAIPVLASVLLFLVYPLLVNALSAQFAGTAVIAAVAGYALWLHWFLARHALVISRLRAALLVLSVNLGTAVLVFGPRLLSTGGLLRPLGLQ